MGGVVEAFVDGPDKRSPSVQCRINPIGEVEVISTHDQSLGGPNGQVFLGASFPADREYRHDLHEHGAGGGPPARRVGSAGAVRGGFHLDPSRRRNLEPRRPRDQPAKGGTTLPFMMLEFLTDGVYDLERGEYLTAAGPAPQLFRLGQRGEPLLPGHDAGRSARPRRLQRAPFRGQPPDRRRLPPDGGPIPLRQARIGRHRRGPGRPPTRSTARPCRSSTGNDAV